MNGVGHWIMNRQICFMNMIEFCFCTSATYLYQRMALALYAIFFLWRTWMNIIFQNLIELNEVKKIFYWNSYVGKMFSLSWNNHYTAVQLIDYRSMDLLMKYLYRQVSENKYSLQQVDHTILWRCNFKCCQNYHKLCVSVQGISTFWSLLGIACRWDGVSSDITLMSWYLRSPVPQLFVQ